jgi:transcriptional regulator with XRE-family HTH domain
MENKPEIDVRFGRRFKKAREVKGWTQTELAKLLAKRGVRVYGSTIAKIEAGARPVKLAELAAAAELFGVSVDALLQRDPRPGSDRVHALLAVADTAMRASDHVVNAAVAIRDRIDDLSAFDDLLDRDTLIVGCERAHELLVDVNDALTTVAQVARGGVIKESKVAP